MRQHSRRTKKMLDFLGEIGGLLEVVSAVGFFCTSTFVVRAMNSAMVNEVYHIQKYSRDHSELSRGGQDGT